MTMDADLMGLGLPPLLAGHLSRGGTGPLTKTAAGTTFATGTPIYAMQYVVAASGTVTQVLSLPTVGGDAGALLADRFIISNTGADTFLIFASTGVNISVNGSNSNQQPLGPSETILVYPVSTTQWAGVLGA